MTTRNLTIDSVPMDLDYIKDIDTLFGIVKKTSEKSFLLESVDIAPIYGQISLMCIDPVVEIVGFHDSFEIRALNNVGNELVNMLPDVLFSFVQVKRTEESVRGSVLPKPFVGEESERTKHNCPARVLQKLLSYLQVDNEYFGIYGATSYDFVRYYEQIHEKLPVGDTPYFRYLIPGSILVSDHIRGTTELHRFLYNGKQTRGAAEILSNVGGSNRSVDEGFELGELECNTKRETYIDGVKRAQDLMHQGYLFEMVLSKKYTADFRGSSFALYQRYRSLNPSPYLFYFDFGEEVLLGASPEMFARVDGTKVQTRPISGTAQRAEDPISDYENMMVMLNSEKEKSELDMLVDLARNDVARVCKPGVQMTDYRYVEKYSRVMHTIAHVEGELEDGYTQFDAFIALLNAGTLTGAPKVEAMKRIEELEPERRGYYGGTVGFFTSVGMLDTAITIRSAHITKDQINIQSGATLLLDSDPEKEYEESEHKIAALIDAMH